MTDDVSHNMTDVARDRTDTTVDVATAAEQLGISEEAVRARIRRGKLRAEKIGALWRVYLSESEPARADDTTQHRDVTQQPVTKQGTTAGHVTQHNTPPVAQHDATSEAGIAPLVEMVREQNQRIEQLSAAAAMWQTRALHLQEEVEQLKQLAATAASSGETIERHESTETSEEDAGQQHNENVPQRGIWARLRRWWKG